MFNLIKFIEMDEDLKEKSKANLKVILRKMKLLNYENINNKLLTPINFIRKKKLLLFCDFKKS